MQWRRLYIAVEGQTEREFINLVLTPHLAGSCIDVRPCIVHTNRDLRKRGGLLDFERLRRDLEFTMKRDAAEDARFTTMIDLYGLPRNFPGTAEAKAKHSRALRVVTLEAALEAAIGDVRFFPYIQIHEFETLLYSDLSQLRGRLEGADSGLAKLAKDVEGMDPEDINERPTHAPSKRIVQHIPEYESQKPRVGAQAAAAIGLPKLREKCPRFDEWVTKLERLGATPIAAPSADD